MCSALKSDLSLPEDEEDRHTQGADVGSQHIPTKLPTVGQLARQVNRNLHAMGSWPEYTLGKFRMAGPTNGVSGSGPL